MKSRTFAAAVLCAAAVGWVSAKGFSDEEKSPEDAKKEKMAKMMELAKPGPEHEMLKGLAGTWAVHGKHWWGTPEPQESDGSATSTMVLGGRYLRMEAKGDMGGMPMEGLSYSGYDRVAGKFINVWMDNGGTGFMLSTGDCSEDHKTINYSGSGDFGWGPSKWRMVLTFTSPTEHLFEMFMEFGGRPESRVMEQHYKKQ